MSYDLLLLNRFPYEKITPEQILSNLALCSNKFYDTGEHLSFLCLL